MNDMQQQIDSVATANAFSGVVRIDIDDEVVVDAAYGDANRAHGIPATTDMRFASASAAKGFTALTIAALIEDGALTLATTARSLLGDDLPLVDDRVTIEHLLGHRSGIGDYLDENAGGDILDYVMAVPVHLLDRPEAFLPGLEGFPQQFEPGTAFAYNNGAFVLLSILAERASGRSYYDLVHERVCMPAGMNDTEFLRSDELDGRAATNYLHAEGLRTNLLHLPVRGAGDGGIFTTTGDMRAFWRALMSGRLVSPELLREMLRRRPCGPDTPAGYGLGFWVFRETDCVYLEGYDAGVSFRSMHRPSTGLVATVISNWTDGAWPIAEVFQEIIDAS